MGTKKMGRPTQNPKVNNMRIRLSDDDMQKLEFCKQQTGKTYADIIRLGIDRVYQELKK